MRLTARTAARLTAAATAGLLAVSALTVAHATTADLARPSGSSASGDSTPAADPAADTPSADEVARRLAEAEEQLIEVEADLRAAEDAVTAAQEEHEKARTAAERAEAELARASRETEKSRGEVDQARNDLGALARSMYQGGPMSGMSAVVQSQDPSELTDRAVGMQHVLGNADRQVDQLDYATNVLSLAESDANTLTEAATQARADAAAALERAENAATEVTEKQQTLTDRVESLETALAQAQAAEDAAARETAAEVQASRAAAASGASRSDDRSAVTVQPGAKLTVPASGRRTSPFGMRTHPITGVHKLHTGLDFGLGDGNIYAAADGVVVSTQSDGAYGNNTIISHGTVNGRALTTMYAHQSSFGVSAGQQVTAGQNIGKIGSTGYSTGPHLHFEVRLDGNPVNPADWL